MESLEISFVRRDGKSLSLSLYSHYTCIYGKFSGEGKTEFVSILEEGISTGDISVVSSLPFAIATAVSLDVLLSSTERSVIMIDEIEMLRSNLITKMNDSRHVFIAISRAFPLKLDYPLQGIYSLKRLSDWFAIESVSGLNTTKDCSGCSLVITEAGEGRSENELLSVYLSNIRAASGRDRLEKLLRNTSEGILVIADLGNIGRAYKILVKRCKDNPLIKFYDYQAFEELLYTSALVQELKGNVDKSVFDCISIEKYYEVMLSEVTQGSELAYSHGAKLPAPFLNRKNFSDVFNSDVGIGLHDFIVKSQELDHYKCATEELSAF